MRSTRRPRVAIFGAGIGGLTAAHELLDRGFDVTLYEKKGRAGGKAASHGIPGSGTDGRRDLPAEHGFRFFPGNYRHVFDSMARTPFGRNRRGVRDNLVRVPYQQQEYPGRPSLLAVTSPPANAGERAIKDREFSNAKTAGFACDEIEHYVARRWQFHTSCQERRDQEYDLISWWDYMDAARCSPAYQDFIGRAPMNFVAARPTLASMRTMGTMSVQLERVEGERGNGAAFVLNGPTSDAWIEPWCRHLDVLGLRREHGELLRLSTNGERIVDARIRAAGGNRDVDADYYVCALPVEVMAGLLDRDLVTIDPQLESLRTLAQHAGWMNGMQFYLDYVPALPPAHQNYIGSPWAITSIVQSTFWDAPMSAFGDGRVRAILSVIVSDWDTPGWLLGKPAKQCTPDEIRREVWHQIRTCADGVAQEFRDEGILRFELDAELAGDHGTPRYENHSPLLVNLTGGRALRPDAVTRVPNLFLAADYVRTHTDLATMESANEAGRRAANGILAASGVSARPAGVWAPPESRLLDLWKAYDRRRFARGLPWHEHAPLWVRWPLEVMQAIVRRRFARAPMLPVDATSPREAPDARASRPGTPAPAPAVPRVPWPRARHQGSPRRS